jgi:hypothetical protein
MSDDRFLGDLHDYSWKDMRRDLKREGHKRLNRIESGAEKKLGLLSPTRFIRKRIIKAGMKLDILDKDLHGNIDGGAYQTRPGCRIHPHEYVGAQADNDALWTRTRRGIGGDVPTHAKCGGCYAEVELVHGKVPEHQPGPPPFSQCPMCGRPYEGGISVYTEVICNECARNVDAQAYMRGDGDLSGNVRLDGVNDFWSGNDEMRPPDEDTARWIARDKWGYVDSMNEWDNPTDHGGIPL